MDTLTDMLVELERTSPSEVDSILREVGDKNRVRVVKYAVSRRKKGMRAVMRKVFDEEFESNLRAPGLLWLDELRIVAGLAPRYLEALFVQLGGELVGVTPNLRTTVGIDYVADSLGNDASRPAVAKWMALTENATAPAVGDTTLTSEITTNGLARAIATYAHTGGATSYTLSKTFTASGAFTAVQKEGIFNASSVGTMIVENTFTATALASGDQLTVTHTLNI